MTGRGGGLGGTPEGIVMDTILFLDFGAGYTDAFSLSEFINCGYMTCALFLMIVLPQKKSKKKNLPEVVWDSEKGSIIEPAFSDGGGRGLLIW